MQASEKQASPSKPRSMLPRTLVVVLSPISDVPTTKLRRFSSKKFEKVFEDFKQCNKQSISVQLQDAVDDIHFVGWISPFTLLIHGSTEDMDTIEHAWIGRMLKPPSGFLIKDFGEISEVKMKQILQSQFISISDTLCEIVKGLNECQIASTFECVVSRLCSSFDSVVIPPMAAIKKSLDLLIAEERLDFINGSYYFKSNVPGEDVITDSQTPEVETQDLISSSKKRVTEQKHNFQRENLKRRSFKNEKVKERTKTKKLENSEKCTLQRRQKEPMLGKELSFTVKNGRNDTTNKVVKSNSLKVRRQNHCIPRRQYSYEELHSHAEQSELKDKKQSKKRNSFIGKISRLFKMEDEKSTSNDETEDEFDICHKEWGGNVNDEQAKLLSNKTAVKQNDALEHQLRENRDKMKGKGTKERRVDNTKQMNKTRPYESLTKAPRHKNVKRDQSHLPSRKYSSRSSRTSTNARSHSRSPEWKNTNYARRNIHIAEQKAKCRNLRESHTREQEVKRRTSQQQNSRMRRYSLSSYSDSSFSNQNNSDYSLSSESSIDFKRKSFHYSDTTDEESQQGCWEDALSKFSSTQAICGDLEMNTLSLNPSNKTTSSSDSTSVNQVEKPALTTGENKNKPLDHDIQQSNLRGRNLVQLIGIL